MEKAVGLVYGFSRLVWEILVKTYVYAWESPDKSWGSLFIFASSEEAKNNAIWNALNGTKRKNRTHPKISPAHKRKLWRSMYRAGWRIRWKEERNVQEPV